MIAIPPIDSTMPGVLVSTSAVDLAAYNAATTYAADAQVSYDKRNWISVQSANTAHTPGTSTLWWVDNGPINSLAMFDTSVQTATTHTGGLSWTMAAGRFTAVGLMGVVGQSATITVRDGLGGQVIYTDTKTLRSTDGTYYSFCFEDLRQVSDVSWISLPGSVNGYLTIDIAGTAATSCGLCVVRKQIDLGQATYGFSIPIEDRGRQYLDALGNPVTVERGYARGCSGTLENKAMNLTRVMDFFANHINTPCLYIAAPGITDLVSASAFGKISRVVPVLSTFGRFTTSIDISAYR